LTIPQSAQVCADTIIVYGLLDCFDRSCLCQAITVLCYGQCFPPGVPVELLSFEGEWRGDAVCLQWETATETSNAGFTVQRRGGDGDWCDVAFVPGHGSTTARQAYIHVDAPPVDALRGGRLWYRLQQIDYDGASSLSPEIVVETSGLPTHFALRSVYPQPADESMTVRITVAESAAIRITLHDTDGRLVCTGWDAELAAGDHALRIPVGTLAAGTYLLYIRSGGEILRRAVLVLR
jgi:hypothetical protein